MKAVIIISVLFLDQLTKFFVLRNLNPTNSINIIKKVFSITLVCNTGAAFGIFKNQTLFFIVISTLAIVIILSYIRKREKFSILRDISLSLILGGALGNLIDRLRFGYVIDFLDFKVWPVFNVADSAITVGVFLLIISLCTPYSLK